MPDAIDDAEPDSGRAKLSKAAISGTVTGYVVDPNDGTEYEAEFKDITGEERQELQELEERAEDGDTEAEREFERRIIDDYLLNDEFTADNTGQAMKGAILVGFLRAIGADNAAIREAETFFEERLVRGNR